MYLWTSGTDLNLKEGLTVPKQNNDLKEPNFLSNH